MKACFSCGLHKPTLYRIRYDATKRWSFICDGCWPKFRRPHGNENPHYVYGGTWKGSSPE
ncbi:MAG: hypothetical protein IAF08_16195 [Rhizobacter sp.]|nr:hypothetical protein [Chlorobiales bacterium]